MASDDTSGGKPAGPVVLRIKLRYDDVEAMVQRFAPNVGKSGLFLPTKAIQPLGTEIKFELRIANDTPVLVGLGKVKAFREPDPANPRAAFGMAIELLRVSREGRDVIIRMIERRRAMGLADVAIPMPEDIESAKRADVETQPRAESSATVRTPMADRDSTPNPIETRASQIFAATAAEKPPERKSAPSEQLLTAPRPTAGPLAVARSSSSERSGTAPVLGPEPVRAKRPRVADVLAKAAGASGATASSVSVPGLDEHVDVERALARARALTSGDVDSELAALRESTAAPLAEISIEAASAELARQLGGTAINKRDRSARWAPPPAVELIGVPPIEVPPVEVPPVTIPPVEVPPVEVPPVEVPPVEVPPAEVPPAEVPPIEPPSADVASEPEAEAAREWARGAEREAAREVDDLVTPVAPQAAATFVDGDAESDFRASSSSDATATSDSQPQRELRRPATSSDEMDQLAAEAAAAMMAREGSGVHVIIRPDRAPSEPAPRPVAVLIDDDADLSSFERALDAARVQTGVTHTPAPPAYEDDDDIAELDSMDIEELGGESTQIGEIPIADATPIVELADRLDEHLAAAEAEVNADFPEGTLQAEEPVADFEEEEISDLDVLAEADADDDDLMQVHGEREASSSHDAAPAYPDDPAYPGDPVEHEHPQAHEAQPEHDYDFAAALDLDDDVPQSDPPVNAIGAYERNPSYDDSQSSSYTFAENFPNAANAGATFDDPRGLGDGEDFDEPHQFSVNTPEHNPQQFGAAPRSYSSAGVNDDNFDEPHGFVGDNEPFEVPSQPSVLRSAPERARSRPDEDYDLENALSTLDVDLDALEIPREQRPQAQPQPARAGSKSRPLPGMPPERAEKPTVRPGSRASARAASPRPSHPQPRPKRLKRSVTEDEGVLIDFDDDDE